MRRFNRKLNNKGVSLLLVIITMSIVSVLAVIVLSLTYRNLNNMRDGIRSADSFYTAERAMDEMRAKFYEWSDESLRVSYESWIQNYNMISSEEKESAFKKEFIIELEKTINDKFMCYFGASPANIEDLFESFTSDRVSWNTAYSPSIEKINNNTTLRVKDISLRYVDMAGYETVITTDLDLTVRYAGFATNMIQSSNESCASYAVITDSQLKNVIGTTVSLDGNVYAGGYNWEKMEYSDPGVFFDNGGLDIFADKIISRKNIEFKNGAVLNAKGIDARYDYTGDISYCNVWASGLNMTGNGESTMKIQGNCYIYDDTTVDAKNSKFEIVGSYYGYNTSNASDNKVDADNVELRMGTPEGSSSIVINGSGSKVNLTQCDPVWIAGKSFVSVPMIYGQAEILDTNVAFPQGESISYRTSQSAYLIPGDCIMGIGHNPMTEVEYLKLKNATEGGTVYIDLDRSRKNGGVNLANYVTIDKPYRVATVSYSHGAASSKLIYLYANFISTEKATQFFQEYYGKYSELFESKIAMLGDGNILFNPATLVTTGNSISYDPSGSGEKADVIPNTDSTVDERIETKEAELNEKYNGLITGLDEDFTGVGISQFITECFVDFTKFPEGNQDIELDAKGLNGSNYHLITGDDITIDHNMNAIVLAKGTVDILNGASINGLIIAQDDVTLNNGKVTAQPEEVSDLILYNEKVAPYFMLDAETSGGDNSEGTYSSDLFLINYENWKKN